MAGFVEGVDREQSTLFAALLDDHVAEDNPVRAVDVFVNGLDLDKLGFVGVQPLDTGRPGYHPRLMLKFYLYGHLNRVPSTRRLERECQRNIEMIWLTGHLAPDFKTSQRALQISLMPSDSTKSPQRSARHSLRTIPRGFVPWRLPDAGQMLSAPSIIAGVRNPAHKQTSTHIYFDQPSIHVIRFNGQRSAVRSSGR
jgi:transposase